MEKISISKVIEFKQSSPKSKLTLLLNLAKEKPPKVEGDSGGGNYWVSCLSAVSNVYSTGEKKLLDAKIDYLLDKIKETEHKGTKDRWRKNIDVLESFKDYDFESIKPNKDLKYFKKPVSISVIYLNGIPVEAKPNHVFSYDYNGLNEIGAIWFIAKKNGYKNSELGMFCDMMYRYLIKNYAENYKINPDHCIAVDLCDSKEIRYSQLLKGEISFVLDETIKEIKEVMSNKS